MNQLELGINKTSSEIYNILKNFCTNDEGRPTIKEPFTISEYTYATDGRLIVRIPKIPEAKIQEDEHIIKTLLTEYKFDYPTNSTDWIDIPKYTLPEIPMKVECAKCDSDGEINCPSCDGDGDLTFGHDFQDKNGEHQWHSYQVECKYCNGYGKVKCDCDNQSFKKTAIRIAIDNHDLDAWILDEFKVFTNVKIAVMDLKPGEFSPILLKFDEGCALLMGLRK
jgi:hypothetical protein